jgi:hypothetical protein
MSVRIEHWIWKYKIMEPICSRQDHHLGCMVSSSFMVHLFNGDVSAHLTRAKENEDPNKATLWVWSIGILIPQRFVCLKSSWPSLWISAFVSVEVNPGERRTVSFGDGWVLPRPNRQQALRRRLFAMASDQLTGNSIISAANRPSWDD